MTAKPWKGKGMEGWTARWYARTRANDMADFRRQAQAVALQLRVGADVLEVAPGPGFFAVELAKLGDYRICGLDVSRTLVEIARENARRAGVRIDFQQGSASAMPFADDSFDFVYCSAAFKNFTEPVKALDEMQRALRPGGRALISDLRKDASLEEIDDYVKKSGRNRIDAWLTRWAFRTMLLKRAYTESDFLRMAQQSRFGKCQVKLDAIALEVLLEKTGKAMAIHA